MKFNITVKHVGETHTWVETYDKLHVNNLAEAEEFSSELIDWFNQTTRPGERRRELVNTELDGDSTVHDWYKRTDGMSTRFRDRLVDLFECRKCGITAKRFGLQTNIQRDSKYRAKKYEKCSKERIAQ